MSSFIVAADKGHFGSGHLLKSGRSLVYTRTLTDELCAMPTIEDDLEKLVALNNKYLARMKNYKLVDTGDGLPPLIMTINEGFERRLSSYLYNIEGPLPDRRYVKWVYQASKGVTYLLVHGIYHKRLSTRTCLLDAHGNIKLCDIWTANVFENYSLDNYWRSLPPETLADDTFTAGSLIWTFANLVWQIYTHSTLLYRSKFDTLADFATYGFKDDEFYLPGSVEASEFSIGDRNLQARMIVFERLSEQLPRAPESFSRFVRQCLSSDLSKRPLWSELLPVIAKEHRIYKLTSFAALLNR